MADNVLQLSLNVIWEQDIHYHFVDSLRTLHTPPDLLWNPAHLSLFARLNVPSNMFQSVSADVATLAEKQTCFNIHIDSAAKLSPPSYIIIPAQSGDLKRFRNKLKNK